MLWQDGCVGPKVSEGFFNMAEVEAGHDAWQKADRNWANRAAKGVGVRGGSKGTRTAYFYGSGFYPVRAELGREVRPDGDVPAGARHPASGLRPIALAARRDPVSVGRPRQRQWQREPQPEAVQGAEALTRASVEQPRGERHDSTFVAGWRHNSMIVAPSPPSPRWPARTDVTKAFEPA